MKTSKYAKKEIYDILDAIDNDESNDIILDSYDDYNKKTIEFMKTKDHRWFKYLFNVIDDELKNNISKKSLKNELLTIPNINKCLIDRILTLIFDDIIIEEKEEKEEIIEHEIIDDRKLPELIDNFKWRNNQLIAIKNLIDQDFKSGIHCQVMGAGKTYIIWNQISEYYRLHVNNKSCIITSFRQEILKDLIFDENGQIDEDKKNFLKRNNIINLDLFNIINRVHDKTKTINLTDNKPSILFVNTDFLKILDNVKQLNYDKINCIIVDECHSVSAPNFYNLLHKIKYNHKIPIFGFSATPLRVKAEQKVLDIFSSTMDEKEENKKLNIISNYDIMLGIKDDVILVPYFVLLEVNKTLNGKIGRDNKNIMKKALQDILDNSPYKKVIGWCKTIEKMKVCYKFMKENFPDYAIYCSSCSDKQLEQQNYNTNWHEFSKKDEKCMMLCVNRFREGSDMKHLDTAIYLDIVIKRNILVSLQTSGRVLRPDKEGRKIHGSIIDSFVNNQGIQVEVITADKIINYYRQIFNLTDDNSYKEQRQAYDEMMDICRNMEYDEKEQILKLKLDDNKKHDINCKLILKTKTYDFRKLKLQVTEIIDKMYGVEKENKFDMIMDKIKLFDIFKKDVHFWDEYNKLDHKSLKIMDTETFKNTFVDKWTTKTWYELLGTNNKLSFKELQILLVKKYSQYDTMTETLYKNICSKNNNIPLYPFEYYKFNNVKNYEDLIKS